MPVSLGACGKGTWCLSNTGFVACVYILARLEGVGFASFSLSHSPSERIPVFLLYLCLPPCDGSRLISSLAVRENFQPFPINRKLDFMQLCPFAEGLPSRG